MFKILILKLFYSTVKKIRERGNKISPFALQPSISHDTPVLQCMYVSNKKDLIIIINL